MKKKRIFLKILFGIIVVLFIYNHTFVFPVEKGIIRFIEGDNYASETYKEIKMNSEDSREIQGLLNFHFLFPSIIFEDTIYKENQSVTFYLSSGNIMTFCPELIYGESLVYYKERDAFIILSKSQNQEFRSILEKYGYFNPKRIE